MSSEVFIVAGLRTPIGALNGALSSMTAPALAAACIRRILDETRVPPAMVDEVILGNVVAAGIGQNPARQAALGGGLPDSVGATTINKVCGSGLKAVMLASQAIRLQDAQLVIAGGMESMSRAPYLLMKARQGYRLGHGELLDATIHDGLWDAYAGSHMGVFGDRCAEHYRFTREEQDDYAVRSYTRARQAIADGVFNDEIMPVEIKSRDQTTVISTDEEPARFDEARLRAMRPAFSPSGTCTAGNASSINDGAAALLIASERACRQYELRRVARVAGMATFSHAPEWFTTAPVGAIRKLLDCLHWTVDETDLFEVNEAFASVAMVAQRELQIPDDKLNVYGGAVALGHPIGASGARILVTLLTALRRTGGRRGIAALCLGGGEAVALAVERIAP